MRSLRFRVILGSALVAIVPLALAMVLLSHRIESMVRAEGAERLTSGLGAIKTELEGNTAQVAEKLGILARDPLLKRLYLLRPAGGRDLADLLSERRFLLGLDFLEIADTSGVPIAEGAGAGERPAGIVLSATAPVRYENREVGLLRGGLVLDRAALARLERAGGLMLRVRDSTGLAVASTEAAAIIGAPDTAAGVLRLERKGRSYLTKSVPLEIGSPPYPRITGLVSTAEADRTVDSMRLASGGLAIAGFVLAMLLGVLWSSQISRPVEDLAAYSRKLAQGEWDEPPSVESVDELDSLVRALDRMRTDLRAYRDRLVTTERQAAWSQMARKVAHEVNNPLTPIAVSVADLKRSYEQRRDDFPAILDQAVRTIGEEVATLKRMLQEFSEFARLPAPEIAPCRLSAVLHDLEALYARDAAEGRLIVRRPGHDVTFPADAGQIRQALVNLVQNGFEALDGSGTVTVTGDGIDSIVELTVSDTGAGLSAEQRAQLFTPGFTTKPRGSGLGLTIVERIVNDHGGTVSVEPASPRGTTFRIRIPLSRRT